MRIRRRFVLSVTALGLLLLLWLGLRMFLERFYRTDGTGKVRTDVLGLATAVREYRDRTGRFPASLDALCHSDGVDGADALDAIASAGSVGTRVQVPRAA